MIIPARRTLSPAAAKRSLKTTERQEASLLHVRFKTPRSLVFTTVLRRPSASRQRAHEPRLDVGTTNLLLQLHTAPLTKKVLPWLRNEDQHVHVGRETQRGVLIFQTRCSQRSHNEGASGASTRDWKEGRGLRQESPSLSHAETFRHGQAGSGELNFTRSAINKVLIESNNKKG